MSKTRPKDGVLLPGDAVEALDATTLRQVQALASGGGSVDYKDSARAATTANITLSGEQTIDGVAVVAGNRVLVKDQTAGAENGLYQAAVGAWARTADADTNAKVTPGMQVRAEEGAQAETEWVLATDGAITLGTTALSFVRPPVSPHDHDKRYAAIAHVDSRDGHPLATTTADGFMAGADKALLTALPQYVVVAPGWTNYKITIATNTWTRLNNGTANLPQITMPAVGAAPTGYKWVVTVRGFIRLIPDGAGGPVKANVALNNGAMGAVHGDEAVTQDRLVPIMATLDVPDPTAGFKVDFGIFGPADTYLVAAAARPEANAYLVRT